MLNLSEISHLHIFTYTRNNDSGGVSSYGRIRVEY